MSGCITYSVNVAVMATRAEREAFQAAVVDALETGVDASFPLEPATTPLTMPYQNPDETCSTDSDVHGVTLLQGGGVARLEVQYPAELDPAKIAIIKAALDRRAI